MKSINRSGSQTLFGNPFMDALRPVTQRRALMKAFPNRVWERGRGQPQGIAPTNRHIS
jgi:hypothetical protein